MEATAIETALTAMQGVITGAIGDAAPLAITVAGLFLAWRYGLKMFKSVSK